MGTTDGRIIGKTKIIDNGPASQRWNLVIMSDGYRESEMTKFAADAQNVANNLLTIAPFNQLRRAINVYRVDVASTDSGADDPTTCGGTGRVAATYFDATFCGNNIRRLLLANNMTAFNVANAQVPEYHLIMIIVNSNIYGGSGGSVAVFSNAPNAVEIAFHEIGHTAFNLADEYEYYRGCDSNETGHDNYSGAEPVEANATINTNRATIKWRHHISSSTVVPTTRNANCTRCDSQTSPVPAGVVGAFEGGRYFHCRIFRPEFNCRMRTISAPFCAVCQERIRSVLTPFMPNP
ncbi:MAG TPA: M64 family metallopeptidase [Pyrinomonadaceae bacterium]